MASDAKGAQTVHRAVGLLKRIALHHQPGISVNELAEASGLDRTTTYRLVTSLVQTGLAERDEDKNYRLGIEAMQLGLAAMGRAPILERCRPLMMRLARRTEDTVFLVVRNGDYAHCVHSEEGSYPVKALVLQVGGMRLLGIGSAGVALLSTMEDAQIESLYDRHRGTLPPNALALPALKRLVAQTRRQGYSTTENLVAEGVGGVGMSFEITPGAYAAISVAAIRARMKDDRRKWIAGVAAEEIRTAGWQASLTV